MPAVFLLPSPVWTLSIFVLGLTAGILLQVLLSRQRIRTLEANLDSVGRESRDLKESLLAMERAAGTDRLTGAWNRRRFEEGAATLMALSRRRFVPLSLVLFDLDHFKRVNDTHGHLVGDRVLVAVSQAARSHLRASDFLVRWGGEEFIILVSAAGLTGACHLAEKVRLAVEEMEIPQVGRTSVSLGVAEYQSGESLESWLGRADRAMYRAKEGGRNRVVADRGQGESRAAYSLLELVWEDSYESGHEALDQQHRELFRLSNGLLAAVTGSLGAEILRERISELMAHAARHFRDEEELLLAAGYHDLESHTREHAQLLQGARELETRFLQGDVDVPRLVAFLALDLGKGHLLTSDRAFFPLLARN